MVDLRLGGAAKRKKLDCEFFFRIRPSTPCHRGCVEVVKVFLPGLVLRRIVELPDDAGRWVVEVFKSSSQDKVPRGAVLASDSSY